MTRDQRIIGWLPGMAGAFSLDGSISTTGTRLEGLVALAGLLPPGDAERQRIETSIRSGFGFLLRAQVEAGDARGGFTGAVRWKAPFHTQLSNEVRIDYVEHALCALAAYEVIKKDRAP
jgi:hypothetical protein